MASPSKPPSWSPGKEVFPEADLRAMTFGTTLARRYKTRTVVYSIRPGEGGSLLVSDDHWQRSVEIPVDHGDVNLVAEMVLRAPQPTKAALAA